MLVACAFAMVAQFYPMPFPESRPLLGVCCLAYFLASTIIQLIVSYAEQDAILTTQPLEGGREGGVRVRTQFPRFQDEYTVILEEVGLKDPPTVSSKWRGGGRKGGKEGRGGGWRIGRVLRTQMSKRGGEIADMCMLNHLIVSFIGISIQRTFILPPLPSLPSPFSPHRQLFHRHGF